MTIIIKKLVQPLWRTVWRFLKKLKIELPYDLAIALLDIYPKDTDVEKKGHLYPNVYSSDGRNRQTAESAKTLFNRQMDKEDVVHIHYGVLCLHQKG